MNLIVDRTRRLAVADEWTMPNQQLELAGDAAAEFRIPVGLPARRTLLVLSTVWAALLIGYGAAAPDNAEQLLARAGALMQTGLTAYVGHLAPADGEIDGGRLPGLALGDPLVLFEQQTIARLVCTHRRADEGWCGRLAAAIHAESVAAGVDPLLITSIVAKESSFKSGSVSAAGAVGLMQLRPFVAEDVAERGEVEWRGLETLHRPELNVRLGILYYKELISQFDGDQRMALTAYNFGPTRVQEQVRLGTYSGSRYADGILRLYERLYSQRSRLLAS